MIVIELRNDQWWNQIGWMSAAAHNTSIAIRNKGDLQWVIPIESLHDIDHLHVASATVKRLLEC